MSSPTSPALPPADALLAALRADGFEAWPVGASSVRLVARPGESVVADRDDGWASVVVEFRPGDDEAWAPTGERVDVPLPAGDEATGGTVAWAVARAAMTRFGTVLRDGVPTADGTRFFSWFDEQVDWWGPETEALRAAGFDAQVWHTGGGCMAIWVALPASAHTVGSGEEGPYLLIGDPDDGPLPHAGDPKPRRFEVALCDAEGQPVEVGLGGAPGVQSTDATPTALADAVALVVQAAPAALAAAGGS